MRTNETKKYFVEDSNEECNNRVFDTLEEVKEYIDEVKSDEGSDYVEENISVYELTNAVAMSVKTGITLEAK